MRGKYEVMPMSKSIIFLKYLTSLTYKKNIYVAQLLISSLMNKFLIHENVKGSW